MRKFVPLLTLLLVALPLAGCSDSTGPGASSIAGTYSLATVGGAALPATVNEDANGRWEVTAGSLHLNDDQTFSGSLTSRIVTSSASQTTTNQLAGTYVRNNNALVLNYDDGTEDSGSVSGSELTITSNDVVFLFRP